MIARVARAVLMVAMAACIAWCPHAHAQSGGTFRANPPGALKDDYGKGVRDFTQYAPGARFPIDTPATTVNSQLRNKGSMFYAGDECSPSNYDEVWWDTYCETRSGKNRASLCKSNAIHQGLDIRGGTAETCAAMKRGKTNVVPVVAVYDGHVIDASGYTVKLRTDRGVFSYLHLNMRGLPYRKSDLPLAVKAGQVIGYMDNDFGSTSTTYHLHLEHRMTIAGKGTVPVPLYCDMVLAYERDRGKRAVMVGGGPRCDGSVDPADGTTPAPLPPPPATDEVADVPEPAPGPTPSPPKPATEGGAGVASRWMHNGSEMGLVARGDVREFIYLKPRSKLGSLVKPGTILFSGRKTADGYEGKAKVFNTGCEPIEYDVKGAVLNDGRTVAVRGVRPVPDRSCTVIRQINDTLVFEFAGAASGGTEIAGPAPVETPPPERQPPAATDSAGSSTLPGTPDGPPQTVPGGQNWPALGALAASRCTRATCVDRALFMAGYAVLYRKLQGTELNGYQVAALNSLLNVWDTVEALQNPLRLAYILATVYHESFHLIYPIRECKCTSDAGSIACVKRLHGKGKASAYHLRDRTTHQSYYGRGQTQLTLKENFLRIGRNLGLPVDLVANPDEALRLDVSARNAVLGLYQGWYRAPRNAYCKSCWLGLRHIPFLSDRDWLAARDVLISRGRHSDRVAKHGKEIAKFLKFIARAEFEQRYGLGESPVPLPAPQPPVADAGSPPEPQPQAPADAPAPPRVPPPVVERPQAPPPAPPGPDMAALAKLAADARRLEENVGTMERRAQDLGKEIAALRTALDVLASGSPPPATRSAFDETTDVQPQSNKVGLPVILGALGAVDPLVDFITRWPPQHKPHAWCGSGDKALTGSVDDDETELLSRYEPASARALMPAPVGGTSKTGAGPDEIVLTAAPLSPAPPGQGVRVKAGEARPGTWWVLPPMPPSATSGIKVKALAPAIAPSAPPRRL